MPQGWSATLEALRNRHRAGSLSFFTDSTISTFVQSLQTRDRISLLLRAYKRYQELGPPPEEFCREHYFESSAHSILIGSILSSRLDATEKDVCDILRASLHYCGHGSDVTAPIRLAETVFANRPYTEALFDAASAYRKALHGLTSIQAKLAKQELDWILWHDSRKPEKHCWSRSLQISICRMQPAEAFGWQWMLRHTTHSLSRGRGKGWLAEAELRLKLVGRAHYRQRLDEWFVFPKEPIRLNPPGSNMARLLVSYGALVPRRCPSSSA